MRRWTILLLCCSALVLAVSPAAAATPAKSKTASPGEKAAKSQPKAAAKKTKAEKTKTQNTKAEKAKAGKKPKQNPQKAGAELDKNPKPAGAPAVPRRLSEVQWQGQSLRLIGAELQVAEPTWLAGGGAGVAGRWVIDLKGTLAASLASGRPPQPPAELDAVVSLRMAQRSATEARLVLDMRRREELRLESDGQALVLRVGREPACRQRVVVDAGHGGHDSGAVGRRGVKEKDVVLDMALRLAEKLREAGCEVLLTRSTDVFVPLHERSAFANRHKADLFVSVHANAAPANRSAAGIETYYLSTAASEKAVAAAERENQQLLPANGDVQQILVDLMANAKIGESGRLASHLQQALVHQLQQRFSPVHNLGVKTGPFHVLHGAAMPSVLVETAFLSNPQEEKRLADPGYRADVALALAVGLLQYSAETLTAAR